MTADPFSLGVAPRGESDPDVGDFRVDLVTGRWWWSEQTYRMHGFEPGEVVPTTAMVLAHKHPQDRPRIERLLTRAERTGLPFRSIHRITDAHGTHRTIVLVGNGEFGPDGTVVALTGCMVDLSSAVRVAAGRMANDAIAAAAASRSAIEQAKGLLAVAFDVEPDTAFDILRTSSNTTNVALRTLAEWLLPFARALMARRAFSPDELAQFLRAPRKPRAPVGADRGRDSADDQADRSPVDNPNAGDTLV